MKTVTFLTTRVRRRGGFILALTLLLGVIAAILVLVFQTSIAQEYRGTSRLVRSVKAEAIAESAIAKIAGILNADRWEERYYLRHALRISKDTGSVPQPEMSFSNHTFPFFEKGPEYVSGITSFVGTIGDAPRGRQRARVRILVEFHGAEFLYIYDLQYSHGLLGPLNRDPVVQRTLVLADVPPDAINATVDAVWDEAEASKKTPTDPADASLIDALTGPPPEADVLTSLEMPAPPPSDFFWPDTTPNDVMQAADTVEDRLQNLESMDFSAVNGDLQQPDEAGMIGGGEPFAPVDGFAMAEAEQPGGDVDASAGTNDPQSDPSFADGGQTDPTGQNDPTGSGTPASADDPTLAGTEQNPPGGDPTGPASTTPDPGTVQNPDAAQNLDASRDQSDDLGGGDLGGGDAGGGDVGGGDVGGGDVGGGDVGGGDVGGGGDDG